MHEALVYAVHHDVLQQCVLAHIVDSSGHHQQKLQAEVLQTRGLVSCQETKTERRVKSLFIDPKDFFLLVQVRDEFLHPRLCHVKAYQEVDKVEPGGSPSLLLFGARSDQTAKRLQGVDHSDSVV